jgi:glycosyltransferase involved in cell wall biosynthesis
VIGRTLGRLAPDVLHAHQFGALFHAGRPARRSGVPAVVQTEHGDHVARAVGATRKLRTRLIAAWAGRAADRVFGVSRGVASSLADSGAIPRRKLAVVPNGIDLRPFADPKLDAEAAAIRRNLKIPDGSPVVGTVGRLAEVKRVDLLVRGCAELVGRGSSAHLLIVGDGPLRGDLEGLARSLGLEGRAHFVGHQSSPGPWLRSMDCFGLASRSEGMPLAILEAWAAGVPVVAARVGGIEGLVEHDRTGLLFDPAKAGSLAGALLGLLGDPTRARAIARAGRARALAEFDEDAMAGTYERHYREVLASRGPTR